MKPDVSNKADIELVVRAFYQKIKTDLVIGDFFTSVFPVNWETHIPLMCAFWESVLFFTGDYEGNPIETHQRIHLQKATTPAHFQQWIIVFDATVNQFFEGANAEKMKQHTKAIAAIMMKKIHTV